MTHCDGLVMSLSAFGAGVRGGVRVEMAQLVESQNRDRKFAGSIPGWSGGRIFLSEVTFLCTDSYFGVRSTPVLPKWHVKDPGRCAESAGYS